MVPFKRASQLIVHYWYINTTIPGHQAVERRLQHSLLSIGISVPVVQINNYDYACLLLSITTDTGLNYVLINDNYSIYLNKHRP